MVDPRAGTENTNDRHGGSYSGTKSGSIQKDKAVKDVKGTQEHLQELQWPHLGNKINNIRLIVSHN